MRWWRRTRNFAIGQMVGGVFFVGIGIAGLAQENLFGGRTYPIIFLVLGVWSAWVARVAWSAHRRSIAKRRAS